MLNCYWIINDIFPCRHILVSMVYYSEAFKSNLNYDENNVGEMDMV